MHIEGGSSPYKKNIGDKLYRIDLPVPVSDVHAVARELWILQNREDGLGSQATYYALQFGPHIATTRVSQIKRVMQTFSPQISDQDLSFVSRSASLIKGPAAPKGMADRLFRHCASPTTFAQIVPGMGAALAAMRGGTVPIFSFCRNNHEETISDRKKNAHASALSQLFLAKSQQLVTMKDKGATAEVEVVSVAEGIVRNVHIPIGDSDSNASEQHSSSKMLKEKQSLTAINAIFGPSKPKSFVFPAQGAGLWKNLTSKPLVKVFACELEDGRLLLIEYSGKGTCSGGAHHI